MRYKFYSFAKQDQADDANELLTLFHHIHHEDGEHEVHHCGGAHVEIDSDADYTIRHCKCGKHAIDKQIAVGHATDDKKLEPVKVEIRFEEQCPDGGWHIESGAEHEHKCKADDDIAFVTTLSEYALNGMDDAALVDTAERLANIWDKKFAGDDDPVGLNREEVLIAAFATMDAATRREVTLNDRYLFAAAAKFAEVAKAAADFLKYPPKRNAPVRSVFRIHARGKSVHLDWLIATLAGSDVLGWTLDAQKPGAVTADIATVEDAGKLIDGLGPGGNKYFKPMDTGGVGAQQKDPEPKAWFEIDNAVIPKGEVGATEEHTGAVVTADRPMLEMGLQSDGFHEYFLTKGQRFNGTVHANRIGEGDEAKWKLAFATKQLPGVLKPGTEMPPDGISAMPRGLMALVPVEYQYWKKAGTAAGQMRDALIASKFFTEKNVAVVGGQYKRVESVNMMYSTAPAPTLKAGVADGEFRIVRQSWGGVSAALTVHHLLVKTADKKYAWTFQDNPFSRDNTGGMPGMQSDDDWTVDGDVAEKMSGVIRMIDGFDSSAQKISSGVAGVLDEAGPIKGSLLVRFEFDTGPIMLDLHPENEDAKIWVASRINAKCADISELGTEAVVSFGQHGPVAYECAKCDGLSFSLDGGVAKCDGCDGTFEAGSDVRHSWEIVESGFDIGRVPIARKEVAMSGAEPEEYATRTMRIVPIGKADDFRGYFLGLVLKPNNGVDGPIEPDTQEDIYDNEKIDYAMRWNAENSKRGNIQHGKVAEAVGEWEFIVVQNYLAPVDFWLGPHGETVSEPNDWRDGILESPGAEYEFVPKGSWLREGKAIGKKLYDGLESGEFAAWSIEGTAVKTPKYISIPAAAAAA